MNKWTVLFVNVIGFKQWKTKNENQIATIQCSRAQCMRMSSIDMGLDYDSTVMLTCKLLFAAAKSKVEVGLDMPRC